MRETLSDLLRQTSPLFNILKIDGTPSQTRIGGMDADKTIIFQGRLKQAIPELEGESAISNLSMLTGLLNFASYNTDTARFTIKRNKIGGSEIIEQFEFKDGRGAGAVFRLMNPALLTEDKLPPTVHSIPWECSFEPDRAKVTEFSQLASLCSEVDKLFTPRTVDGALHFMIGDENSSTHRASIIFQEGVSANIRGDIKYSIPLFQAIMKVTAAYPTTLHLTSRGVMKFSIETPYGEYDYILRAVR